MKKPRVTTHRKKRTVFSFPVIVHGNEADGYWVECVGLEGCYSQGETIGEALRNVREAIALCLEDTPKRLRPGGDVSVHFVSA